MTDRPDREGGGFLRVALACMLIAVGLVFLLEPPDKFPFFYFPEPFIHLPFAFRFLSLTGLIHFILAIWVGVDANRRGMNGLLWGVLVFFTSIVGLIVYLIVGQSPTARNEMNNLARKVGMSTEAAGAGPAGGGPAGGGPGWTAATAAPASGITGSAASYGAQDPPASTTPPDPSATVPGAPAGSAPPGLATTASSAASRGAGQAGFAEPAEDHYCGNCGAPVEPAFRLCPYCGDPLGVRCPACSKPVAAGWKVCPHCAGPLEGLISPLPPGAKS